MRNRLFSLLQNNLSLAVLLAVVFAVYAPSLSGDFIIDDIPQVKDNPYIREFSSIPRYFSKGLWENSALGITSEKRYLPMTLVPMLINHKLWGDNPFGYHLFLLLLQLTNTGLVYALIRKITAGSVLSATFGAAIFALHPTKVGSVAWIIGGVEPLVAFFLLGAMLAHLSYVDNLKNGSRWGYLAVSLVCFQLALWSKEVAVVFPAIVAAHDLIFRKKIAWKTIFLQILMVAGYIAARSYVLGGAGVAEEINVSNFSRAIDFALGYIEMLVFPIHVPFYILSPEHQVSSVLGLPGAIVLVALSWFCWKSFDIRRRKICAFSVIWSLVLFWPAILLSFYTEGFYSPRYLYVPSVGLAMIAAVFYDSIGEVYPRLKTPLMASCAILLAVYGFLTWKEIPLWHDNGAIYKKVTEDAPEDAVGFLGLGQYYFNLEEYAKAESNYLLALQKAKTPNSRAECLVALGTINGINNNLPRSESYFQEAVKIQPGNSDAWSGLGNLAWMRGQPYQAITFYEKALSIRPDSYEAATNLANAYEKTGQSARADSIRKRASSIHR